MIDRRALLSGLPAGLALVGGTVMAPRRAPGESPLRVLAWPGYDDPVFYDGHLRRGAGAPLFEPLENGEAALARLRGGLGVDVAQPCLYQLGAWIDGGVVRPMPISALANWEDLWPPLRQLGAGPADGEAWFAPFDWGPASVIYRTDLVATPPRSWWAMYDDRFAGRLAMQRSAEAAIGCAALALGVARPWAMDDDEQAAVAELLARQRAVVRSYWDDPFEVEAGLERGDLVAAYGWNDIYARLRARGVPVAFMAPEEGYLIWVCGLASVAAGDADPSRAYSFIDAMLAPGAGAALIARYGYGHANRRAFDLVPGGVLAALALDAPGRMLEDGLFMDRMEASVRSDYLAMFDTALAAL